MFSRKRSSKGSKPQKKNIKARKVVKRLLEKPGHERMAAVADQAALENLQPFNVSLSRFRVFFCCFGSRLLFHFF